MKRFLLPVAIAAGAFGLSAQTALASTATPYTGLAQGYDISWPQCGTKYPHGGFGIAGIDHGRPFDVDNQYAPNPCLGSEYAAAQKTSSAALYMNTGYDPSYYTNHPVQDCVNQMSSHGADDAHRQAWEVGCAFAWYNEQYALTTNTLGSYKRTGLGLAQPAVWWLDVETGNSWSSTDLTLNSAALQGAVDELGVLTPGVPVGAYSTSYQWGQIAGSNPVTGLSAVWVATGQRSSRGVTNYCTKTFDGFARAWLVQWVYQTKIDYDVPC